MMDFLRKVGDVFLDFTETLVIGLSIFLVVYLFFVQPHQVNGQSMVPNFQNGEYVLTNKFGYRVGEPKRGDVVVFHAPPSAHCPKGTGCDFIKRVIALPGETLEVKNCHYYINGRQLPEPYIPVDFCTEPGDFTRNGPVTMGANEYFVSGDNRPYSSDSRAWGPVTPNEIVGKVFFVYWPLDAAGLLEHPQYPF